MYKLLFNSKMPRFFKWLLIILLTISCVYWILLSIYKLLDLIRLIIHWITERRNWWTFIMCLFVLGLGSFLIAQFVLGLDPWGKVVEWFLDLFSIIPFLGGF